jgi:hypothetical protein
VNAYRATSSIYEIIMPPTASVEWQLDEQDVSFEHVPFVEVPMSVPPSTPKARYALSA